MDAQKPTRSKSTRIAYGLRAQTLSEQAAVELEVSIAQLTPEQLIAWFLAADGRWARATIRQYRAALRYALEELCRNPTAAAQARAALEQLNAKAAHPEPAACATRRTSAKKRRKMTPIEAEAIDAALQQSHHRHAPIARWLMWHGVEVGLRPIEWSTARMEGSVLVVTNAKHSNDRGNGATRRLDLGDAGPTYAAGVANFLKLIAKALTTEPWDKIHSNIRYLLSAASKTAARRLPSLRGARISPYTLRHVATARAKVTMDDASVAALLGHASDRTAKTHYARERSARGWRPTAVGVDPEQVATVRRKFRPIGERPSDASPKPRA